MRESIFISYHHKDERWRRELEDALSPYAYTDELDVWSDDRIETSADWEKQIDIAIAKARVAVLIITPLFFRSKYIASKERIDIFARHARGGLDIWAIPFLKTADGLRNSFGLNTIQWPRPPDEPLSELSDEERMFTLDQICGKLVRSIGLLGHTSKTGRDAFGKRLAALLGSKFADPVPIAPGDLSIVYKAEWTEKRLPVAIKAILPSTRRQWVAEDFAQRAEACTKIYDARFIVRTYESINEDRDLPYAVMEFMDGADTLETLVRQSPGGLNPSFVASAVAQLCYAASELHTAGLGAETGPLLLGPLRPKNVFVKDGRVRVSPLHISHATLRSCRARPTVVLDDDALTYLTPEQFFGEMQTVASDQYYIGLLGIELLRGKPIGEVSRLADLLEKERFFDAPAAALQDVREREPALFFVLARMLERYPADRWPDAKSAGLALERISQGGVPDEIRREALSSYSDSLENKLKFFERFYAILFRDKTIDEMFNSTTMKGQHRKLSKSLIALLNFYPGFEPSTLKELKEHEKHRHLTYDQYRCFKEAFLEALAGLAPPPSHYTDAAWRAVFDVAIAYMAGRDGAAAHPSAAAAKPGSNLLSNVGLPSIVGPSKQDARREPAPLGARAAVRRAARAGPGTEGRRP